MNYKLSDTISIVRVYIGQQDVYAVLKLINKFSFNRVSLRM